MMTIDDRGGGGSDLTMTFDDRGGSKIANKLMTSYMTAPQKHKHNTF